jgi:hypothetical protein
MFEAKVREAAKGIEDLQWDDESQAREVQANLREWYPDAEVMMTPQYPNAPRWDVYRDGLPRRLALD